MLIFHITRWKDVWVPCRDPTESPRSPPHLVTWPQIPWQLESHVEFTASNVDDAWQFLNIVRNRNITVSNRKWSSVSLLTSISVRIALRSLAYIPEVSIITTQECWRCWRNTSIEMPIRHTSRKYPRFLPQLEKINETSPSVRDEAQFPCIVCSAIPCSQYNVKGALICLMELQIVPKNNLQV